MKVLFFGDVVGKVGRLALIKALPALKKKHKPDLTIINAENLTHGSGATKKNLKEMQEAGVDFFTSGNHIWSRKEIFDIFKEGVLPIIRPANYPAGAPGQGYKVIKVGQKSIIVLNLLGRVFFNEDCDCPFRTFDQIIKNLSLSPNDIIIVDFHAEATSEKVAFGQHTAKRASAVLGTHTHIATADEQILAGHTAYITDAGMVGAKDSIIGTGKEEVLKTFLTQIPHRFEYHEKGEAVINGVLVEIDNKSSQAKTIKRVYQEVKV